MDFVKVIRQSQQSVAPGRAIARANRRSHGLVIDLAAKAVSRTRAAGEPRVRRQEMITWEKTADRT